MSSSAAAKQDVEAIVSQPLALQALLEQWASRGVRCRDAVAACRKAQIMASGGAAQLQLICDFDYTLSRFRLDDGQRSVSTHACIETYHNLPEHYRKATRALFEKYYPIEVSNLTDADKAPLMVEWWTQAHQLMVDAGLRREQLKDMASNPRLQLRKGVDEFLRAAHGQSVPVHIFSAGLYDVIHAYLELQGLDKYGAHVVSNMMEFEPDGRLLGFKGNLIHTLNKNSRAMRSSPGWERVEGRKNVLLLGDNLGDVRMADGLPDETRVLTVGFLNDKVEERRSAYETVYDIVVEGDPDFAFVNQLFKLLLGDAPAS